MRVKKIEGFLLIFVVAGIVALQIISLVVSLDQNLFSMYAATINNAVNTSNAVVILIIAILISVEVKNLDEFNIDKFSIITLILFPLLRLLLEKSYLSVILGMACVLLIVALFRTKPNIVKTNFRWTLLGMVLSAGALIIIFQFELHLRRAWLTAPLLHDNLAGTAIMYIVQQLSSTSLPEEILFRGFIWGYLRRDGWGETKTIWIQGILFWLLHFRRIAMPFTFFVSIPILTILSSQLTKRSKQVFPAILSHTIINAVSAILNLSTF